MNSEPRTSSRKGRLAKSARSRLEPGSADLNLGRWSKGMEDYYRILGVQHNSEDVVIRAAYTALIKKYHPDVYEGDRLYAEMRCKEINQAYEVLSDSAVRH